MYLAHCSRQCCTGVIVHNSQHAILWLLLDISPTSVRIALWCDKINETSQRRSIQIQPTAMMPLQADQAKPGQAYEIFKYSFIWLEVCIILVLSPSLLFLHSTSSLWYSFYALGNIFIQLSSERKPPLVDGAAKAGVKNKRAKKMAHIIHHSDTVITKAAWNASNHISH